MLELPRACLIADKLAPFVEFFSFGSNDATQIRFRSNAECPVSYVLDPVGCMLTNIIRLHPPPPTSNVWLLARRCRQLHARLS